MILESVIYYVRCASFCNFWTSEIISVFKGFRLLCFRLTDKFSRHCPPPSHSRWRSSAQASTLPTPCLGRFRRAQKRRLEVFGLATRCSRSKAFALDFDRICDTHIFSQSAYTISASTNIEYHIFVLMSRGKSQISGGEPKKRKNLIKKA